MPAVETVALKYHISKGICPLTQQAWEFLKLKINPFSCKWDQLFIILINTI